MLLFTLLFRPPPSLLWNASRLGECICEVCTCRYSGGQCGLPPTRPVQQQVWVLPKDHLWKANFDIHRQLGRQYKT